MIKMLIQLDEEKIKREKVYDLAKLWQAIDKTFAEFKCIKEVQENGAVLYSGNPQSDNYMRDFGIPYMRLSEAKWFADTCSQWIWYDNEDDENLPLQDIDVLMGERSDNPLFAVA